MEAIAKHATDILRASCPSLRDTTLLYHTHFVGADARVVLHATRGGQPCTLTREHCAAAQAATQGGVYQVGSTTRVGMREHTEVVLWLDEAARAVTHFAGIPVLAWDAAILASMAVCAWRLWSLGAEWTH